MIYALEPEQQALVDKIGGKAASLEWVKAKDPSILIPEYHLISDLSSEGVIQTQLEQITSENPNFSRNDFGGKLFRSSAQGDEKGLVGVLLTKTKKTYHPEDGEEPKENSAHLVNRLIQHGNSKLVRDYAQNFDSLESYDDLSSVIIMERINSFSFSVVQHPNNPELYVISSSFELGKDSSRNEYLVDKEGNLLAVDREIDQDGNETRELVKNVDFREIVEISKKVDECVFIPHSHSSQKEFVLGYDDNIYFLQQRFFLPFTQTNFFRMEEDISSFIGKYFSSEPPFDDKRTLIMGLSVDTNSQYYDWNSLGKAPLDGKTSVKFMRVNKFIPELDITISSLGGHLMFHDSYRLILKLGNGFVTYY